MKFWTIAVSVAVSLPLVIEFCDDGVLDQNSHRVDLVWLSLRRRLWTRHSTTTSGFHGDFLGWFWFLGALWSFFWVRYLHCVVSCFASTTAFYQIIIVALSLIMSLFRTFIGIACCPYWKCLSFLDYFIYIFNHL